MKPISITNRPKRKPRQGGSIQNENISWVERKEYQQTGMIRIKETAAEGLSFHPWSRGLHDCINFASILGGHEVATIPDGWNIPLSCTVFSTEDYGLVAVDSFPDYYIVRCRSGYQQSFVSNLLNLCGYDSHSGYGGGLVVRKPRKRFVAYDDWKREQEEERKF